MVSKRRGIAEVSVMEVSQPAGIRTRARTAALFMADHHESSLLSIKRRKVRDTTMPEQNSVRPTAVEDNSSSDEALVSCCSSNGSRSKLMDLEDEREAAGSMSTFSERETTLPNSNLSELEEESAASMNSMEDPSEAGSRQETNKKASAVQKPTKVELDEFFAEYDIAMKEKLSEITEKYNFNFMEDKPLEGVYDWVSLRP